VSEHLAKGGTNLGSHERKFLSDSTSDDCGVYNEALSDLRRSKCKGKDEDRRFDVTDLRFEGS